jgi:hypothetical protein
MMIIIDLLGCAPNLLMSKSATWFGEAVAKHKREGPTSFQIGDHGETRT